VPFGFFDFVFVFYLGAGALEVGGDTLGRGDGENLLTVENADIRHRVGIKEVVELALVILLPVHRHELHIVDDLLLLCLLCSLDRLHHLWGGDGRSGLVLVLLGAAASLLGLLCHLRSGRLSSGRLSSALGGRRVAALAAGLRAALWVGGGPLADLGLDPALALSENALEGPAVIVGILLLQAGRELLLLCARHRHLVLLQDLIHAGGELNPDVRLPLRRVRVTLLLGLLLLLLFIGLHSGRGHLRALLLEHLDAGPQRGHLGLQDCNHLGIGGHLSFAVSLEAFRLLE